jgi:type II protein arginine methyltransferase
MNRNPRVSPSLGATPGALIKLGCALMGSGKGDQAVAIVRKLLAERPDDPELLSAARIILSHRIPSWHLGMLRDSARNVAFEAAIARSVFPGCTVLDIGTGSGLLAMMAARAGAGRVVACEADPALAETAREIVEANGYSRVIEVLGRSSTELDRERDLGGGADLVVAEIFSDDLLNEGALPTLRHAARDLLRTGGRMIPRAASVRVALARGEFRTGGTMVRGFDLSLFQRHTAPGWKVPVGDERLRLCSAARDLFEFDFGDAEAPPSGRSTATLEATEEGANGLVQWLGLTLDDAGFYENRPAAGASSHWAVTFHPFREGRVAARGEPVRVDAAHDGERLQIWFE